MRNKSFRCIVATSLFILFISCNKDSVIKPKEVVYIGQDEVLMDQPPPNYTIFPLVFIPYPVPPQAPDPDAGKYRAVFSYGPTITITQPVYQLTCPGGAAVVLRNGIPAWTETMVATPNAAVELLPNSFGNDNHFVVTVGTFSNNNFADSLAQHIMNFNTAMTNYLNRVYGSNGQPLQPYYPNLNSYVDTTYPGPVITYRGKLIRTTTGSGFALAYSAYPEVLACLPDPE